MHLHAHRRHSPPLYKVCPPPQKKGGGSVLTSKTPPWIQLPNITLQGAHSISLSHSSYSRATVYRGVVAYYNKEYREGFPRGFLLTAAVDSHRSRRLRWLSTAKVGKNPLGISRRYFFILSTILRPHMMLKYVKEYQNSQL